MLTWLMTSSCYVPYDTECPDKFHRGITSNEYWASSYIEDIHFIDGSDVERSNWLRFLNCPNHRSEENIATHFCYGRVFHRTKTDLYPGQELLTYYGDNYVNYLKI
ncbi:hypothetical protein LSH36_33g08076 [Paralvinella palmiformis]|uniref:SET domain-containing protein n=1 Tax=Paralvinella palmiformis TaxID=53620 RepID=A0AAD9NFR8_9ANNE|nr:hypothetical protein LSH36_33g08076 [Paralvinella palmiformis]